VSKSDDAAGHVFISYVREDAVPADRLAQILEKADIRVWRDRAALWPGQDWRAEIRRAITRDALVFLACFSRASLSRGRSYQNEELAVAIEQLRLRGSDRPWLVPVRFDDCQIPDRDIGGGRGLTALQQADLYGASYSQNADQLVGAILRLLGRPARGARPPATRRPPIVAEDRSSLIAHTLQPVKRLGLFARHLDGSGRPRLDSSGNRRALLLIGEGGIGKSVLLGQYLDRIDAAGDRAAVLVPCTSIEPDADLKTKESTDLALGAATADPFGHDHGLLALLSQLKSDYDAVSLLVDTLDLRISERSLVPFSAVIADALKIGDVITACRTQEYRSFLQGGAHRLAGRIDPFTMPSLTESEIIAWAERYLDSSPQERPADRKAFLNSLSGGMTRSQSLRNVCSLPVRLALTCQTFADSGHVPPELTVVDLFRRYWHTRITHHGGLSHTDQAYAKQDAALKLASLVVQRHDGRVVLRVPSGRLGREDRRGLELLASEGVIRDQGTYVEFFHQTFAEYAHARWLLSQGIDAPEIAETSRFLAAGQISLWDIVTSLLLQVRDFEDYCRLARLFPVSTAQAARARAAAALRRTEASALTELMTEIDQQVDVIPAVIDVLSDTSYDRLREAYSWTVGALHAHPAELAKIAATALAAMLPRHEPAEIPEALRSALDALIEADEFTERSTWTTLTERLVLALSDHPALRIALPVLREMYSQIGERGQQASLRAHLALGRELTSNEISQLARCALASKCPGLHDDEAICLVAMFWNEPGVRADRGWDSVLTLVRDPLPGGWQNGQVRFAVASAETDELLRADLFDSAYREVTGHTENNVNVAKRIAESAPEWSAHRLLALGRFDTPRIVQAVLAVAESLARGATPEQRDLLIDRLKTARDVNPRSGFSAEIILADDRADEHREIIQTLEQRKPSRAVLNSVFDTWLFRTPAHLRIQIAADLRRLLSAPDAETRQRRARLEAVLAVSDTSSRDWIASQVLHGQSPQVAATAVTSFERATGATDLNGADLDWLIGLLPTRHTEAARAVAALIKIEHRFGDDLLRSAQTLVPTAVERLRTAVERGEASLLMRALVELLARVNRASPLPADLVEQVFELISLRLKGPRDGVPAELSDQFAAVTDLRIFVGQVMAKSLPAAKVRIRVGTALLALTDSQVRSNVQSTLVTMLKGLGHDDLPNTCTWMRNIFSTPGVAPGVQLAIAEAMLDLDGPEPGGRAAALEQEANCPVTVATYLQRNIRR